MILTRSLLILALSLYEVALYKKGYRRQIKYGYPAALLNKNFGSNKGFDFFFGLEFSPDFSPIFGFLMYKSKEHTNEFFTEYYVNSTDFNIYYSCKKYEVHDESTIFLWAFESQKRMYSDPMPSMCDICNGNLAITYRLTDKKSGKPICTVDPPEIKYPVRPAVFKKEC